MNDNVENLAETVEKLTIEEPKFEKWNELPPEIKLECIKTLDFKTKWSLRSTCHTERALVDSLKMKFKNVKFKSYYTPYLKLIEHNSIDETTIDNVSIECLASMFSYILNRSSFENLKIVNFNFDLKKELIGTGPWNVKNLEIKLQEMFTFCLNKVSSKLEKIVINVEGLEQATCVWHLMHSKALDAPFLKIIASDYVILPGLIAQHWIKNDVEIGRTFQVLTFRLKWFEVLSSEFLDRSISVTSKYVRFRTENPSKHILFERGTIYFLKLNGLREVIQMKVIPADMKESNINTKWMDEIKEKADHITTSEDSFDLSDSDYY